MILDHIGIVVKSIDVGLEYWKNVFDYVQFTEIVYNGSQNVKIAFMKKDKSLTIKLIEPVNEKSSIYNFMRKGGGLHHLCFKCNNIDVQLKSLKSKGLRTLTYPEPGEAFDNENIAFVYAKNSIIIELIDTDKKSNIIFSK